MPNPAPPALRSRWTPRRAGPPGILPLLGSALVVVVFLLPAPFLGSARSLTPTIAAPVTGGHPSQQPPGAGHASALPACQWGSSVREAFEIPPAHPAERAADIRCALAVAAAESRSSTASAWSPYPYDVPMGFPLYGFVMASDSEDHAVLLFGGVPDGTTSGASVTWEFQNGTWTELHPKHSPESCLASAMTDDPVDGYVVYLGGLNETSGGGPCSASGQTWEFEQGDWTQLHPSVSPPAVGSAAFANDSADGYLVLFGGENTSCVQSLCNETWTFSGGSWTLLHPSLSPSNRAGAGLTYDGADHYLLLFGGGGYEGSAPYLTSTAWVNDTWSFRNGTWTDLNITHSPPEPFIDGLTYDAAAGVALYTDADDMNWSNVYGSELGEELWSYHAGNWTQLHGGSPNPANATNPEQRVGEGAAYDWSTGSFVLYGGTSSTFASLNDTWTLAAGQWSPVGTTVLPSGRQGAGLAYDAADGYAVLFGGVSDSGGLAHVFKDTWQFENSTWTQVATNASPPARYSPLIAYDASDGYLLLFGGYNGSSNEPMNDTWEYTNGGWSEITPDSSPAPTDSGQSSMTYDGADGEVLLLETWYFHAYTWTYHAGLWTNLTAKGVPGPNGIPENPVVYDSEDGYVLLAGVGVRCNGNAVCGIDETWSFRGGGWANITAQVAAPLPLISGAVTADDPAAGYVLLYGGYQPGATSSIGIGNDSWEYVNGSWSPAFSPEAVPIRSSESMTYDPATHGDLLFGGYSWAENNPECAYGVYCDDLWAWSPVGLDHPAVESFVASPAFTDVNFPVTFHATVVGGTAPYNYTYASLPPGCVTANTSSLSCTPATAGVYAISLRVTDTSGNEAGAATNLWVHAGLSISSFAALTANVTVGERTLLSVQTAGGVAPVGYNYTALPPGCTTQTIPTLPCSPEQEGNYSIRVVATDAVGSSASANLTLSVSPVGGWGGFRIVAFSVVPPALVLGNATTISLTTAGGSGAVSYSFDGLPPGCAGPTTGSTGAILSCYPTSSGIYPLTLHAADSTPPVLAVETNLTVYPVGGGTVLEITAFAPSPGLIYIGYTTQVEVAAEGGAGALSYAYHDLPAGCASANTSTLSCTPTAVGNFTIEVVVSDTAGHREGAFGRLAVLSLTAHTHPPPGGGPGTSASIWQNSELLGALGAVLGALTTWVAASALAARRRARQEGESIVTALNDETN